jgi:hypothetical protein
MTAEERGRSTYGGHKKRLDGYGMSLLLQTRI